MTLSVIGAGFGRTGTLSLKAALEQLGFNRCYHMMEVMQHPQHMAQWQQAHDGAAIDWSALFEGYAAAVDWPSCNFWREQLAAFPEARVILSRRDPQQWYASIMNTIYPSSVAALEGETPGARAFGAWAMDLIWKGVFDDRMDDADHVIGVFERHQAEVIAAVPADRLLVFEASQGWAPLCAFLEVPVPDTPYPRSNSTADFRAGRSMPPAR